MRAREVGEEPTGAAAAFVPNAEEGVRNSPGLESGSDPQFGRCPRCHQTDGYKLARGLGFDAKDVWFLCVEHRVKWWGGYSLFPAWQYMSEEHLLDNACVLRGYRTVKPWMMSVEEYDAWRERQREVGSSSRPEPAIRVHGADRKDRKD